MNTLRIRNMFLLVTAVAVMFLLGCGISNSNESDIEADVNAKVTAKLTTSPSTPTSTAVPGYELINYSSYQSKDIQKWVELAESNMKSRKSKIFLVIYPVGKMKTPEKRIIDTDYASGVYREHEVLLSQDKIETILSEIELWLKGDTCVPEERKVLALSDYRTWLQRGANTSFQQGLCETTRVVMMAIHPQIRDHEGIEYFHYFLLHELYHAFSQDLENGGECRRKRNEAGLDSNSVWMYEGGAHYFATWLVAQEYNHPDYRSRILEDAIQSFRRDGNNNNLNEENPSPDRAGAAALSLMIEFGMVTEESILDGSLFHNCDRELKFDYNSPEIQNIKTSWYLIEENDGGFQFKEEALNK